MTDRFIGVLQVLLKTESETDTKTDKKTKSKIVTVLKAVLRLTGSFCDALQILLKI